MLTLITLLHFFFSFVFLCHFSFINVDRLQAFLFQNVVKNAPKWKGVVRTFEQALTKKMSHREHFMLKNITTPRQKGNIYSFFEPTTGKNPKIIVQKSKLTSFPSIIRLLTHSWCRQHLLKHENKRKRSLTLILTHTHWYQAASGLRADSGHQLSLLWWMCFSGCSGAVLPNPASVWDLIPWASKQRQTRHFITTVRPRLMGCLISSLLLKEKTWKMVKLLTDIKITWLQIQLLQLFRKLAIYLPCFFFII